MTKKYEELVEEMLSIRAADVALQEGSLRQAAINRITRIAQAYEGGELMLNKVPPKLPGEEGRATGMDEFDDLRFRIWLNTPDEIDYSLEDYRFIALSPGGQEEEG